MNCILFHIPHASLKIPKQYWKICLKDKHYIEKTNYNLSDYLVDKLIPDKCHKLIFKYSRLFCDVEKFKNDSKEIMFMLGMGVIYTNDCDNQITIPTKKYKRKIIKNYYDKYHSKLNKIVSDMLRKYNKCLIIDLHSFSDEIVKKLFNIDNNPDICIGIDNIYSDKTLVNLTIEHFKKYGYSVEINKPYSGTIIPNKYYNKRDNRLVSIMIEINKRIYLENIDKFVELKKCLTDYYNKIKLTFN